MAGALLGVAVLVTPWAPATPASAATAPITQCNNYPAGATGSEPTSGAVKLVCEITVTNNLDVATGLKNSTVSVRRCVGAANSMPLLTNCQYSDNITPVVSATDLVDTVTQCNYSASTVGGSTLICYINIINNVSNVAGGAYASYSAVSVDQCVGSGGAGSTALNVACDPYPATTSGAAVTQCNGSGYGGGTFLNCQVASDVLGSALPITLNQCNNSVYGGGDYLDCRVNVTNHVTLAAVTPPVPTVGGTGTNTSTRELAATGSDSWPIALSAALLLLVGIVFSVRAHEAARAKTAPQD